MLEICFVVCLPTVTLEANETKIKFSSQNTQKYIGIIDNVALARILRKFTIKADAKLVISIELEKRAQKQRSKVSARPSAVLFELSCMGLPLTSTLSEYDSSMQYCNSHYLRPGSQMPTLEEGSGIRCGENMESHSLNASNKGRFMRKIAIIFWRQI